MTDTVTVQDAATPQAGHSVHDDNVAKLLRMAGQISDFFEAYPEAEAVLAIADHINQFWTGRMRDDFRKAHADRPDGLPPLLRQVLPLIRPARTS